MILLIKTIDHKNQAYPTVGNWTFIRPGMEGELLIEVSDMNDWRYQFLVGLHEAVEAMLCDQRGLDERAITNFDIDFELNRKKGNKDEPGDSPKAPYRKEHKFATKIEKMVAKELGVDWKRYERAINNL